MKVSEWIYRCLLRVYPRDVRDEYGEEMSGLFRARVREGGVTLWLQILGDLTLHAPREHWNIVKQDVRYGLRSWRRAPTVPAIALTALTLGMGANTAIFSVIHAVMLQPLPVHEPGRLMLLHETRLLGIIGVYGVTSYMVALRAHELGLRAALGARPWTLLCLVIGQGLRVALVGVAFGLTTTALVADRVRSLLFEVDARDPAIFAAVGFAMTLVALAASYVPARRAASADPLVVLRAD